MNGKQEQSQVVEQEQSTKDLRTKFFALFDQIGVPEKKDIENVFQVLVTAYSSKDRFYHTLEHIRSVLKFIEMQSDQLQDRRSVELAVWFHDAVYDTKANDNEEKSSILARGELGKLLISESIIQRVELLVRATKTHEVAAEDADGEIFLDSDLSILGAGEEAYNSYTEAIRKEYTWVPAEAYRAGRKTLLENFISRERIFKSESAYRQFEQPARDNIQREISKL